MRSLIFAVEPREAIRKIIDARNISNRAFADMLDTAEQSVSTMLSGSRTLTDKTLAKMTKALNIPFDVVKYGKKEQLDQYIKADTEEDSARVVGVNDLDLYKQIPIVRYKVWATFVDNFDEFDFDDIQDTYPVYLPDLSNPPTDDTLIFEILGDSMESTLLERAKVLAELVDDGNIDYLNAGVYIVAYRKKLVTKRIIDNDLLINGTLTLHSDNPIRGKVVIRREDIRRVWHVTDIVGSKVK